MYSKDAIYYDKLNSKLQVDDIAFYQKVIPKEARNICEVACGTGRILFSLHNGHRKLTGIDLSKEMLEIAEKKRRDFSQFVQLIQGDMCELGVVGCYDVIICGYNSMQHICDDLSLKRFFQSIANILSPDGVFILDVFNPNQKYLYENGNKCELAEFTISTNKKIKVIEETLYHPDTLINDITYNYYINGVFGFKEHYHMKQYTQDILDMFIEQNGYTIRRKYGDYSMNSFSIDSPKQIYILQKKRK